MKKLLGLLFIAVFTQTTIAQDTTAFKVNIDSLNEDAFVNTVEQSLNLFYLDYLGKSNYDAIIDSLNYEPDDIPTFSDDVYCERLAKINEMSPFQLDCTPQALSTIKFFASNRRSFARVVLGRSKLYFEMFEEKLAKHDMPLELKYLAVIESGLRPQVKSRAGALGLWQFMYRTGLYYGLNENSYIDERMDPELATEAACRYLKKLHGIYNDWNLALAAYNAGPGNVNKAIRRSGNKKTYWEVRPFLPRETQGYVPNFIAAAYLLTYHAEHNIIPVEAKWDYAQMDTMCFNSGIHMSTITTLTGWPKEEIEALNPIFKTSYIPYRKENFCIQGPMPEIGKLVKVEKNLYALEHSLFKNGQNPNAIEPYVSGDSTIVDGKKIPVELAEPVYYKYHTVRKGETIGKIAAKYGKSVKELMELNKMKSTVLYTGQRVKIQSMTQAQLKAEANRAKAEVAKSKASRKYYTVRNGDVFSVIARRHNMTQSQLKRLNPGINISRLRIGQKIRIR